MNIHLKENNFWQKEKKPIKVLAPMAGYTDSAFRLLCRQMGADVVMSELVSADAIAYGKFEVKKEILRVGKRELIFNRVVGSKNHSTAELLSFFEEERPFVVQLFGKFPEKFGLAAKWLTENLHPDGIDINMGCPARKVVGSDHGAALLKDPSLACEIVRAVKVNTDLPVSVKTRLGWDDDDQILDFVPKLQDASIDSIMIHGRTYKDGFKGKARWENIYKVKEMVGDSLAVIGNGDLQSIFFNNNSAIQQCNNLLPVTLDGFAIGRATFGQPWLFTKDSVSREELKKIIQDHAELSFITKGERGMIEFRKHLLSYLKNFPGAKDLRKEAVSITTKEEVFTLVERL